MKFLLYSIPPLLLAICVRADDITLVDGKDATQRMQRIERPPLMAVGTAGTVKAIDINTGKEIEAYITSPEITPTPTTVLHTTIITDGNNQRIGEVRWTRSVDPDGTIRLTMPTRDLSAGATKTAYVHVVGTIVPTGNWPVLVCAADESPPYCSTTSPPEGTGQCDRWDRNVEFEVYLVVPCPPTNFSTTYRYYMNGIQVGQWNISKRSFGGNCKDGYVASQTTPVLAFDAARP